jgi:predicted transcriptional regulator YheO
MINMDIEKPFNHLIPVADMIAATFGINCEVVIYDLRSPPGSLVYINGNLTGRPPGAPATSLILKEIRKYGDLARDMHGFTARTQDGRMLKTSITFLKDDKQKVIGYIGINYDMTDFAMAGKIIGEFCRTKGIEQVNASYEEEYYAKNIEEIYENMVAATLTQINIPIEDMKREDKVEFIRMLDQKGCFMIQGSIDKISEIFGVTRQTIYNYLEEVRSDPKEK